MKGTIKSKLVGKPFGFIAPEDGSTDIFFHESSLVGVSLAELNEGDTVTFEVEQAEKGPRAKNVTRA